MTEYEKHLKVLDVFCGKGGWSKPFLEDGDEVWGIDIEDHAYPGKLIQEDIRQLDGYGFSDMDFIIGSHPCQEVSIAKHVFTLNGYRKRPEPEKAVELFREFYRFVKQAQPDYWAMENTSYAAKWWKEPPIWRFPISIGGRRLLWGKLPISMSPDFRFRRHFGVTKETRAKHGRKNEIPHNAADRSEIPYPIARFIADTVRRLHSPEK